MEKILTQEEINALLHSEQARKDAAPGARAQRRFTPFVFGKATRISRQQVKDVAQIHEAFAYRLKNRLAAYLQTTIEINPMSVDELPYSELTQSLAERIYMASVSVHPGNSIGILSIDLPVAFSMIDLMLGGDGKGTAPERPVTEIEARVLQAVIDMICDELTMAWRQVVEISIVFRQVQRQAELFRLLPTYEKMLFLSFEIRMPDVFSTLTVAFPAAVSSMLLKKLGKRTARNLGSSAESRAQIKARLKNCAVLVEMLLPPTHMLAQDLLDLNPGQTVVVEHSVSQSALINVAGNRMFEGYPVRRGARRGALIHERIAAPLPREKVVE
ncbi:MAG: FliM/FliN family flagellar motor switch protein [Acidobacteriota bacterium]|nr:FliM/FliN family flagellar motor switch protein [Acidobacteriota bacterium]